MSRTFTDDDLQTWEAFASAGHSGLADHVRVVFHCISDPQRRARFVPNPGDEADAEAAVHTASEADLRTMLKSARELD